MKKLTLAVSAAVAMAVSGSAMAQDTGFLDVSGTVPALCILTIVPAGPLDLTLYDWQDAGDVTGSCNSGLPTVRVRYTAQDASGINPANAAFVHDDGDAWIEFDGRVTAPGVGISPVGLAAYDVPQNNAIASLVELRPYGTAMDKAGNYETSFLVEVFPN